MATEFKDDIFPIITPIGTIFRMQESCELEVQQILNENNVMVHKNTPINQYEEIMNISCLNNNIENVKKLTEYGILRCYCITGLLFAIMFNNSEIVNILLHYGIRLHDCDMKFVKIMAESNIKQLDLVLKSIREYSFETLKKELKAYHHNGKKLKI